MFNTLRNLTPVQWYVLALATAGVINGSTAQLTEWFGPIITHSIISVLSFGQTLVGAWVLALTGQGAQIKNVLAMPGVQNITVNSQANPTLAAIAVDPAQDKIEPVSGAEAKLTQTAKGV